MMGARFSEYRGDIGIYRVYGFWDLGFCFWRFSVLSFWASGFLGSRASSAKVQGFWGLGICMV